MKLLNTNFIVANYKDIQEPFSLTHIAIYRQNIDALATFLKLSSLYSCDIAIDAFAIDCLENSFRFTVIYSIQSSTNNIGFQLKTKLKENTSLISLEKLYPAFNWAEREIWDLFGIFFIKHPDLRRILTDYGFSGHPLRKDFPISGFKETHYSDKIKQITYSDIELSQSFRLPAITSLWINA